MSREHWVVALLVSVVIPASSWHDGSGWLAWTMFSRSQTYRMAVRVENDQGAVRVVNPAELASRTAGNVAAYLAGADHFRHSPGGMALRRNLTELAGLACQSVPRAVRAAITLELRMTLDAPTEVTTAEVRCEPGGAS